MNSRSNDLLSILLAALAAGLCAVIDCVFEEEKAHDENEEKNL